VINSSNVQEWLTSGQPFVVYRMPQSSAMHGHAPSSYIQVAPKQLEGLTGFAVAAFVLGDRVSFFEGEPEEYTPSTINEACTVDQGHHKTTTQAEYNSSFEQLHQLLATDALSKVVLSKIKGVARNEDEHPLTVFHAACAMYPNEMVYLLQDPTEGVWLGATPETLLQATPEALTTMALAGTVPLDAGTAVRSFTPKEYEEQEWVSKAIRLVFEAHEIPFSEKGPQLKKAAAVGHLCSVFEAQAVPPNKALELALELHPTPAVCGLPRKDALFDILEAEQHERGLYTGFLGPVSDANTHLFVNLRCMRIVQKEYLLFLGGGLTTDSVAAHEWEETEQKAKTLLSVIEKIR